MSFESTIRNEHGIAVKISVQSDKSESVPTVTIFGEGPDSVCEHIWTQLEAETIWRGLNVALGKPPLSE